MESTSSSSSSSASASASQGVRLHSYVLASGSLQRAMENASSIRDDSTDEQGEEFYATIASTNTAAIVTADSVMILPLSDPAENEVLDFTYLAASDLMFVQIHGTPQPRMTYGHCLEYSHGVADRALPLGSLLKFPTTTNFIIAKPQLLVEVRYTVGLTAPMTGGVDSAKRPCLRPRAVGGELAEDVSDKSKGTSQYLLDLDGVKHVNRNKTDIHHREKDLYFVFRAMDIEKWDYSISSDVVLQPREFLSMLSKQGDTRSGNRHAAFTACGLISIVFKLEVIHNTEKLKLLLTGAVLLHESNSLLHESSSNSLTLDDFVTGERVANKPVVCPANNAGLISVLRNFQTVMQIVFSDCFETCLSAFIKDLEGANRPMELVTADFLKYSVEQVLRDFFRVVRTAISAGSVSNPTECALFLSDRFRELATNLSTYSIRVVDEQFFQVKLARPRSVQLPVEREKEKPITDKVVTRSKTAAAEEMGPKGSPKTCTGHFGGLVGAVKSDGRPYACSYGKECVFWHLSIDGSTEQKLLKVAAVMPTVPQRDIVRAIKARK